MCVFMVQQVVRSIPPGGLIELLLVIVPITDVIKIYGMWMVHIKKVWFLKEGRNEGNVLFNDTLNTFYFTVIWRRTYGKGPLR